MKKNTVYIICAIVIVVALAAMLVFVFTGKDSVKDSITDPVNNSINNSESPTPTVSALVGTWEVVALMQNGTPTFMDNEFMVFDAEKAASYRDGASEPIATSTYSISDGKTLKLPEIAREYVVSKKTENIIELYETPEKCLVLVRYMNADRSPITVNEADLVGKWNVEYRPADKKVEEVLEFSADTLNDYRDGATEPSATSPYHWENGSVFADAWNKAFEYHMLSKDIIYFVESDTGIVWELHRIK